MKRLFALAACLLTVSMLAAETITFRADSLTGTAGSKSDTTRLQGHAFVKTETMEIAADVIELFGDNFRYITAEGAVTGKNTESLMDFTCGKMRYDRQTKVANLESSVHLVDVQNEVTADAQVIEYNQTTEIAVMQINVTLKQKDNTCTAAYAVYRKNDKMLEMSGNPKIVQGEDTFRAQEITLDLDTQEITLDGRVSGTVTDTKKAPDPAAEEQDSADENPAEEVAEDSSETAEPVPEDDGTTDGAGDE
ncbi:MAG: LPS export ABC transporter periplasmic protein LptC [Treponemataceae bacterium]|nr:LPS export ABC transporter periplasmic protein LptC [Treponemataceae bacterium]